MDSPREEVQRFAVTPEPVFPVSQRDREERVFPRKDLFLLIGEAPDIKAALAAALIQDHYRVRRISWGKASSKTGNDEFVVSPAEDRDRLVRLIRPGGERIGAILNLEGAPPAPRKKEACSPSAVGFFNLLKTFEKDLKDSAAEGGGWIFSVTFMGGRFGLKSLRPFSPEAAAISGITKAAALEWPKIRARCIDVDPEMDEGLLAGQLWHEITGREDTLETGIDRAGRWALTLEEKVEASEPPEIHSESVLLVLGGASGITAEIAKEMARRHQPRMILVGRSIFPESEAEETRHIQDVNRLRSFLIQSAKDRNEPVTPSQINTQIKGLIKQRQLLSNIKTMKEAGAKVEYHALDVTSPEALSRLIETLYKDFGRIDGVIHGAGVIEDRLIRDKSVESFSRVYETKVIPAKTLAEKLNPESLKFLVFFSSISARFGNVGQCDYSAANEVLNKYAHDLSGKWPQTRVVSIGWGPWETGMITEELKKFYRKNAIRMIPTARGVDLFFKEIAMAPGSSAEIVVTADIQQIADHGLGRAF